MENNFSLKLVAIEEEHQCHGGSFPRVVRFKASREICAEDSEVLADKIQEILTPFMQECDMLQFGFKWAIEGGPSKKDPTEVITIVTMACEIPSNFLKLALMEAFVERFL